MATKNGAHTIGWLWYSGKPRRVINDAAAKKRSRVSGVKPRGKK